MIQKEIEQLQTREQTLLAIRIRRIMIIDPTWPDKEYAMLVDSKDITQRIAPREKAWVL